MTRTASGYELHQGPGLDGRPEEGFRLYPVVYGLEHEED